MSAAYRHCVNGLLTSIVLTLTGRLYDVYITDIVYVLDVLVVIVYMSYCNCWDYLLLHEDWGECSEDWAGACRWGGGGGIFNWNFFFAKKCSWGLKTPKNIYIFLRGGGAKFVFPICSWGSETHANKNLFFGGGGGDFGVFGAPHAPTRGSRGVGKQYTSSYDHDMWPVKILERSGLAVKSYHPETLAAEEEKKKKNSDKTIRHSRREAGNA